MICTVCLGDDRKALDLDRLSTQEMLTACRTYRCARCSETEEQTQARLSTEADAEWRRQGGESAHDWESLMATGRWRPGRINEDLSGSAPIGEGPDPGGQA